MSKKRMLAWIVPIAVLAFCLYYLATAFQWAEILPVVLHARLWVLVVGGVLTTVAFWLLRTVRFSLMLRDHTIPFRDLYFTTVAAMTLSMMTPAQSGELIKVEMLKRTGHVNRLPGYSAFVAERGIDAVVLLSIAFACAVWQFHNLLRQAGLLLAILLMMVVLTVVVLIATRRLTGKVGEFLRLLRETFGNGKLIAAAFLVTIACWVLVAAGWWVSLASVEVMLSPLQALALMTLVTVVNLVSMVPGSVGISEVSTVSMLAHYGVEAVPAQAAAVMLRAYGLLIILLGCAHWLWWRRLPVTAKDEVTV